MRNFAIALLVVCGGAVTSVNAQPADTTSTAMSADSSSSSARAGAGRDFRATTATVEKMWDRLGEMYRKAGVSEDRIAKLKEIDMKAYSARANGEKIDTKAIRTERDQILTTEEKENLQKVRAESAASMRREKQEATQGETTTSAPASPTN